MDIPDISFRSQDEFRQWERVVDSLGRIVEILKENKNNVALCEEILSLIHDQVDIAYNWFGILITEWCGEIDDIGADRANHVFEYQSEAIDLVISSLEIADQAAQVERRGE